MKNIVSIALLLVALISCNDHEEDVVLNTKKTTVYPLENSIFYFAPILERGNCSVYGECDCCSQDIFFDKTNFIYISYCLMDISVSKGTYSIVDNKIQMKFDSICYSSEYNWENEVTQTNIEYFLKKLKVKPQTHYINILRDRCNNFPVLLDSVNEQEKFFGIKSNTKKNSLFNALKERSIIL
jgi:hypothetical protein